MRSHHWLVDGTRWDSFTSALERLRRELCADWIKVRSYESEVIAPNLDHATRSLRRYVEANTDEVVVTSLGLLASVGLGVLIAGGF